MWAWNTLCHIWYSVISLLQWTVWICNSTFLNDLQPVPVVGDLFSCFSFLLKLSLCCFKVEAAVVTCFLNHGEIFSGFSKVKQVKQITLIVARRQKKCSSTLNLSSGLRLIFISRFSICLNFFCSFLTSPICSGLNYNTACHWKEKKLETEKLALKLQRQNISP